MLNSAMQRPSVLQAAGPSSSSHQPHPQSTSSRPPARYTPYTPGTHELHGGPRNRLFLSLRSGIPSEIDWALPRLVVASYDLPESFRLETWLDSVGALQHWPEKWVDGLERVAHSHLDNDRPNPASKASKAIFDWTLDPQIEKRATESLLALRNASFTPSNAKLICRQTFLALLDRFFALPLPTLIDVLASYPETASHIFVVLLNILPYLYPSPPVLRIYAEVLPVLIIETRDLAMIQLLLPLLISTAGLSGLPNLPDGLVPHLFMLLSTQPGTPLLDLILDALLTLSSVPRYSRQILSSKYFPRYIRTIVPLLRHGAQPFVATIRNPRGGGKLVRNPASSVGVAEMASRKRAQARESAQAMLERGERVEVDVGDKMPVLAESVKARLYTLPEPQRSIEWMHEMFVYSSNSQLLQVTFWHAYRDFFTHPSTKEMLLSASEVIKNVTVAFPGASAKIWIDDAGVQKFVIAGMGFRKGSDEDDRFACRWRDCPGSKHPSPASLLNHVTTHILPPPSNCAWGSCPSPFSTTHLLTHIPSLQRPLIPEHLTLHPTVPDNAINTPTPTSLPPAPLSGNVALGYVADRTDMDRDGKPGGPAFLAALILRGLARALRAEIVEGEDEVTAKDQDGAGKDEGERYGLPIPESVLREEEEEERLVRSQGGSKKAGGGGDGDEDEDAPLGREICERAKWGFMGVEEALGRVLEENVSGLGGYLGECLGW